MRRLATWFKALGDETRLEMIGLLLGRGEICVCDFVEVLGITQSKASRHLRYLVHAGLLQDRRGGPWVYYRLAGDPGPEARAVLRGVRAAIGRDRLAALAERLERARRCKRTAGACPSPRRPGGRGGAK